MRGWLSIGLWMLACALWAQLPTLPGSPSGPAPAVPASLLTPQSSFSTFLVAAEDENWAAAAATLDLSSVPPLLREAEGERLAQRLYRVLARIPLRDSRGGLISLREFQEMLPSEPGADRVVIHEVEDPRGVLVGVIEMSGGEGAAWQFTPTTVGSLDAMWSVVQSWPPLRGEAYASMEFGRPSTWLHIPALDRFEAPFLGLLAWQWVGLAILLVGSVLLHWLVRWLMKAVQALALKRLPLEFDAQSGRRFRRSVGLFVSAQVGLSLLPGLQLPSVLSAILVAVYRSVWIVAAGMFVWAAWDAISARLRTRLQGHVTRRTEAVFLPFANKLVHFLIVVGVALGAVASFGYNVWGVLAGLGLGGVALALAAKDSIENVFGSITILFDKPFSVGDWVVIGNLEGTVEEINLRSTRIRTFADSLITLPNSNLIKASVENMGARTYRRFLENFGLSHDTPRDKVVEFRDRVYEYAMGLDHTRKDNLNVSVNKVTDSSIEVMVYVYFRAANYTEELSYRQDMLLSVLKIADELDISLAFPARAISLAEANQRT